MGLKNWKEDGLIPMTRGEDLVQPVPGWHSLVLTKNHMDQMGREVAFFAQSSCLKVKNVPYSNIVKTMIVIQS